MLTLPPMTPMQLGAINSEDEDRTCSRPPATLNLPPMTPMLPVSVVGCATIHVAGQDM